MALIRWRPTEDFLNMRDEMNRLLNRFFESDFASPTRTEETGVDWYPVVDIAENNNEFIITAELPGLKKDDIHVSFENGMLRLEGDRKRLTDEKGLNFYRTERNYGHFIRTFQLPVPIDETKIDATYRDGILTIHVPKAEEVRSKEIEVKIS